jgi:hypothetical protein
MKNLLVFVVYGAAALGQTKTEPIPLVLPSGVLGTDPGISFDPVRKAVRLGLQYGMVDLIPKNTEQFGVMGIRSALPNSPSAFDVFPNGYPTTWDRAWIDVCQQDLIANPTIWNCAILGAFSDSYVIGAHQSSGPYVPLYVGGNGITFQDHVGYGVPIVFGSINSSGIRATNNGQDYFWAAVNAVRLGSGTPITWAPSTSVYNSSDAGIARAGKGIVRVTGGTSAPYGSIDASGYSVSGTAGLFRTVSLLGSDNKPCTITFVSGIATASTCP